MWGNLPHDFLKKSMYFKREFTKGLRPQSHAPSTKVKTDDLQGNSPHFYFFVFEFLSFKASSGRTMQTNLSTSDNQILRALRKKGVEGWNLFCDQFDPLICSITEWPKWNFSEEEKQDVRQEIYIQLQSALPNFQQKCSLCWFIKKIAMRQCINEIRRQIRWRTIIIPAVQKNSDGDWCELEFENGNAPDPHYEVLKSERLRALTNAMNSLKATCKTCITLFYVRDLSYREIAERLGVSVNTVGSRLSKCLNKLQSELRQNPLFEREKP